MSTKLRSLIALIGAVLLSLGVSLGPGSTANATGGGNNGTIKIHEQGTPSGTESNDPKVCVFNVEGYNFDAEQTGYLMFNVQGGDGPTGEDAGPFNWGPTNEDGRYDTQYFNLKPGHYKATLYGKMLPGGQLDDIKAKSKVFKVVCEEEPPPVTPEGANNSFSATCETITVGTPTGVKPEGATVAVWLNGEVTQPGTYDVEPGNYTVKTFVNGTEVDEDEIVVAKCESPPPTEPEGKVLLVSNTCETVTFSVSDVKPEDATVVVKLDGVNKPTGTYDVEPGQHTVELWVNGEKVDSKTVTVEECQTTPPDSCPALTGSVKTTLADGSVVNGNIYTAKSDVYISGSQLGDVTKVYIRVTDPSGSTVLSDVKQVSVTDGSFGPVQLPTFADTPNNGDEYKVWVSSTADFEQECTKFDNFKVRGDEPPPPTSVTPDKPSATQPSCEQPNMTVTPGDKPGVV